jgi:tetratricopeptide (TPR) repeat protein
LSLIRSFTLLGRFADAAVHEAEAIRLAETTHDAYTVAMTYQTAALVHVHQGDTAKVRALFEREIEVLRAGHISDQLPGVLALSAKALLDLGDVAEAQRRLQEAERLLEEHVATGRAGNYAWAYRAMGAAHLLLGQIETARRHADRALEDAAGRADYVIYARLLLGDIATHPQAFDEARAEVHYRYALSMAEPRGMRPLVARGHHGLGTLFARMGKREQASEHLETAAAMYREMDMRAWLEQLEAEKPAVR